MKAALAVTAAALTLAACGGGGGGSTSAALPGGCQQASPPQPKHVNLKRPNLVPPRVGSSATVVTSCGSFRIALDVKDSPKTTASFAYLARKGVYDDTTFHRIVPNFVIQGGDPLGNGEGGPGYFVDEAPPARTAYTQGTVAMAKTSADPPGRSGSQFFVVTEPDAGLPPVYAVLGKVVAGQDTVSRIAGLGTPSGTPQETVLIKSVRISG
jgi:cyclophilin family peptidyl-prolyl cis-trans isomerase